MILELGANDMLNGLDPSLTEGNLEKIIVELRSKGARVLLAGMRASPETLRERSRQALLRLALSRARERAFAALLSFFLEGVFGDPKLVLWGGLHPNRKGVRRIVDRIAPLVESALGAPGGEPQRSGRAL